MIIGLFGVLGAILGSFAGAQVWRLRAKQLIYDKKNGEEVDSGELKRLKPLAKRGFKNDRSQCLKCKHELAWYDLLPVVSWLALGGKCRYCRAPIGMTEILLEVVMALVFAASLACWPGDLSQLIEIAKLIIWMAALVVLAINFVYDMKWSLLVGGLNWALIGLGLVYACLSMFQSTNVAESLLSLGGSLLILGGLYAFLWLLSRGRWVGDGDIYLGAGLALFLGSWPLAFVALFAANALGTIIVLPMMATGHLSRGSHMPFGPLLIAGFLLAWFIGDFIINWYLELMFL